MNSNDKQDKMPPSDDFLQESERDRGGLPKEILSFLAHNKKWWLLPIIVVLLLVMGLVLLGGTAVAPFIYTLF